MDLGAHAQISKLETLAKINGIDVPRLRGYRLMSDCEPYTKEEIESQIEDIKGVYRDSHASLSELYFKKYHVIEQCEMWNKYAGRSDVLYIHSRMGGRTYEYGYNSDTGEYEHEYVLDDQPWFLDHVRDAYDGTYCDIYALITVFPNGE